MQVIALSLDNIIKMKYIESFSRSDNSEQIPMEVSNMLSNLQRANWFHYVCSIQIFYILVLTSSVY